jgi:iron complex transport system ATP-binding protein
MAFSSKLLIEVSGLHFGYHQRVVIHDVGLHVAPGKIVGLLGPNGSGKSTILKVISGILGDYQGTVQVAGREVHSLKRRELGCQLAVVPQESTFGFSFSALEIVLMGRHPHLAGLAFESQSDIDIASNALDRCGALDLASRPIHELSAGERQRVVFARALAQQTQILLLDEPASFLDIRHQVELYDIVRELTLEHECGVLTVMHDLNLAAEYCDYIYLLANGRIAASGPTAEVLTYTNLTQVFETEVYVDVNTLTGKLLIAPLSARNQTGKYYK